MPTHLPDARMELLTVCGGFQNQGLSLNQDTVRSPMRQGTWDKQVNVAHFGDCGFLHVVEF